MFLPWRHRWCSFLRAWKEDGEKMVLAKHPVASRPATKSFKLHEGTDSKWSVILKLTLCLVAKPHWCFCREEWAYYLRIEPKDEKMLWLVRAMMETELPKPWTCYKARPATRLSR